MGLMSKIEDKLSSNKDGSKADNSSYTDSNSSGSHMQHPISNASNNGYGNDSVGSSSAGTMGGSSNHMPGSHGHTGASGTDRDGYGSSNTRYDNSTANSGGIRGAAEAAGFGGSRKDDRYDDSTTSSGYGSGQRQPYDNYSRKGQHSAADTATGYSGGNTHEYGRDTTGHSDPSRSQHGGILNPNAHNRDAIPTAGGQKLGSSGTDDPYSSNHTSGGHHHGRDEAPYSSTGISSGRHHDGRDEAPYTSSSGHHGGRDDVPYSSTGNSSSHNYGRDAAMAGGAGALGAGAGYGSSRHHEPGTTHSQPFDASPSHGQHGQHGSHNPQDISHMNRQGGGSGQHGTTFGDEPRIGGGESTGPMGGSTGGMGTGMGSSTGPEGDALPQSRKMGGAYEAGYRDAMEHVQAEVRRQ